MSIKPKGALVEQKSYQLALISLLQNKLIQPQTRFHGKRTGVRSESPPNPKCTGLNPILTNGYECQFTVNDICNSLNYVLV